ncbi:MAG: hypothetical protein QXW01_02720 [Candidatus Aenigmatarchaeota archaeon]
MSRIIFVISFLILLVIFLIYSYFIPKEKIEIIREYSTNSIIKELNLNYSNRHFLLRYSNINYNESYSVEIFTFQSEEDANKFFNYLLNGENEKIISEDNVKIFNFNGKLFTFITEPKFLVIIKKYNSVIISSGSNKENLLKVIEWIIKGY